MKFRLSLLIVTLLAKFALGQKQITISLITDQGVKNIDYLNLSILKSNLPAHNFEYSDFSKDGKYPNTNLYQYNFNIDTGLNRINLNLKALREQNISDSFTVDHNTSRVEVFIFISTDETTGAYIKEVKTLKYLRNPISVKFSFLKTPQIGSPASFNIENVGINEIYGYPNNALFFGTLYENIEADSWIQHYPNYINIEYCDTVLPIKSLAVGQVTKAWTPNDEDCSEFKFTQNGKYFFELLYSSAKAPHCFLSGMTKFCQIEVFRQIFEFEIKSKNSL
jgi:hypothetical protein